MNIRAVGAVALGGEAVVLLLAIQPLRQLASGAAFAAVAVLCLVAIVLVGLLRHAWAWWAGAGIQVALLAGGVLHWSLAALGVAFGLAWAYVLYVRRRVSQAAGS